MRFTAIEKLPNKGRKLSARQMELLEFMNMGAKCVKITLAPGEYSNLNSAQSTLIVSAKKAGFPIKVRNIDGELYLVRTDM